MFVFLRAGRRKADKEHRIVTDANYRETDQLRLRMIEIVC